LPGPETPGGAPGDPPVEDQAHLIGSAYVHVVTDDLLEEHPAAQRAVEHLGERELALKDADVIEVAGGPVRGGERMGKSGEPFADERVDPLGAERVADGLQGGGVLT
jgi:hypothetical protein